MVQQRTEEDKLLRAPIVVILGGVEYSIPPLVIKDAREWRKKFATLLQKLPAYAKTTTDHAGDFEAATQAMYSALPNEVADLFFAYAKSLDRDAIESSANEAELSAAFEAVMEVALPLVQSLGKAMARMARQVR
ncbi:MAG: hypothetical protein KJ954_14200 [Alphaproteobacteria bacterium]|nr:hypothetical protein [Alphaproteobacteria bacterium]